MSTELVNSDQNGELRFELTSTEKTIRNRWKEVAGSGATKISSIVERSEGIEGIEISRYSFGADCRLKLNDYDGHLFSILSGSALLRTREEPAGLSLANGTHVYVPPGNEARLHFKGAGTAVHAATDSKYCRGERLLIHDERFIGPSRFVLTPQYLSRRAFLHRDETLLSKSGDPVGWFHTTMFDTHGLPSNDQGAAVFKMSYDYQSEVNVIYDVKGRARVRFAIHPYTPSDLQKWTHWSHLDADTTYYLNESKDGPEVEHRLDSKGNIVSSLRNRHEVFIEPGGFVSLCCMFDPAPTGLETHQPGEYSSYGAVENVLSTGRYARFLSSVAETDEMIRELSLLAAKAGTAELMSSPYWSAYQSALLSAQTTHDQIISEASPARREIIRPWRLVGYATD